MSAMEQERAAPMSESTAKLLATCDQRRQLAKSDRRRYEPTWQLCKSFIAGRQWVDIDSRSGRVVGIPEFAAREKHTVNVITQYLQTVLGKLYVEDLRPDIAFTRDDIESETIATHTQNVAKYVWETEVDGDKQLYSLLHKMLGYGTAALRCYYDKSQGETIGEVPIGPDGEPIMDIEKAVQYISTLAQQGQQAQFEPLREGRSCWEALGPGNILVPPGVEDDAHFPWLIIETAMHVDQAKLRFPKASGPIRDQDVATLESLDGRDMSDSGSQGAPPSSGRLREHLIVSTMYEMPTLEHPKGRVVTWNSANKVILDVRPQLPYTLKGRPHHGVVFFHYHRVPGRFLGIGVVEPLIGPQRQKNRARSQMIEMKDRNLGRVYARKGTITTSNRPVGKIMELIEIPLHADFPQETTGVPVGPWIENEARMNDEDMDRVSGLREVSLGQAPTGVSAYSAMALLAEQDERRVGPVLKDLRRGIGDAMLLTLDHVKRYWQEGKQLAISGPSGRIEVFNFTHAGLPLDFYVNVSKNAPLPTSPAVESQKIFDLFNAATSAGQPLPVDWLKDSLDSGHALPIPKREEEVQSGKAEQENFMLEQGMLMQPAYYDDDFIHIQVHRQAQIDAGSIPGQEQIVMMLEQHIQMHAQNAAMKKPTSIGNGVPQQQGPRGIEAQNGSKTNQKGAAQAASGAPPTVS